MSLMARALSFGVDFSCDLSLQPQAREQGGVLRLAPCVSWVSHPGSQVAIVSQDRTCFAAAWKRLTFTRAMLLEPEPRIRPLSWAVATLLLPLELTLALF